MMPSSDVEALRLVDDLASGCVQGQPAGDREHKSDKVPCEPGK